MNYHEKSAWICTICLLAVYVPYFVVVAMYPAAYIALFVIATVFLAVLMGGFHAVMAITTSKVLKSGDTPELDEMDRLIELKASKYAGIVTGVLVLVWTLNAFILIPANAIPSAMVADPGSAVASISITHALAAVHVLFLGFAIANLVYYVSIIVGYRRLA
jgi:hypothetical protein